MRRQALLLITLVIAVSTAAFFIGRETSQPAARTARTVAASALRMPTIQEDFTLLPCAKATTIGLEGCAEHRVLSLDRRIDQLQLEVFHRLPGVTAKRRFVRAASEWAVYRRLTCLSAATAYQGGTFAPVSFADCLVLIDRHRLDELATLKANFSESH
jgi:uncharacterized protein YecT (DUF1311 family)